jgi:hypothetical protein
MAKISIPKTKRDFNDVQTAYFAGIIDGEAHIGLIKRTYKGEKGRFLMPVIKVHMTCEKTVRAIGEYFGCGSIIPKKVAKAHHKPQWSWQVAARNARFVATMVLPFSITRTHDLRKLIDHPVNEKFGPGKITTEKVRIIRIAFFSGTRQSVLAKRFNTTRGTIWSIVTRETWAKTDLDLPTLEKPKLGRPPGRSKLRRSSNRRP